MTTKVLTPDQAADYLGVSGVQLYRWRKSGNGLPPGPRSTFIQVQQFPWGRRGVG